MVRSTRTWHKAALVAALTATAQVAGAQSAPVYSADVEVEESIVDEHGAVVEARPKTRFRMAMRRTPRGIQTEIVYPEARLYPKGPLLDPRGGIRIVTDGDLATARVYGPQGRLIVGPPDTEAGPTAVTGPTQASGMVLSDRGAQGRHDDLIRRFGPSLDRLGGRDRYLASEGDDLTETLVEPSTMLPVEINVARGGALAHRTSIAYGRMPGGRWYVATTRSEVALPGDSGRRFVSNRSYLNVVSQEAR